ncbi:hypothetical protein NECAME_01925 [Necator americanus]|uniref:Uncharacterized protein n=1 Tax=Necator americanus TaxID=51031 RepID=W2TKL5_NECAM|nr:hypothetical protein NECAME_01925 [Necator americanus]ETN82640.1 hypothetical protein NECAME_01925 [Necator americanus]
MKEGTDVGVIDNDGVLNHYYHHRDGQAKRIHRVSFDGPLRNGKPPAENAKSGFILRALEEKVNEQMK